MAPPLFPFYDFLKQMFESTRHDWLSPGDIFSLRKLFEAPQALPDYHYDGQNPLWYTNHTAAYYLRSLFPNDREFLESIGIRANNNLKGESHSPRPYVHEFFAPDTSILELGAGEGLALTQLYNAHRKNDTIVWIGVDKRYSSNHLDVGKRGSLQFAQSDVAALEQIPDKSVDRIMDVQAAFSYSDSNALARELRRVAKPGAILRSMPLSDRIAPALEALALEGWNARRISRNSLVARLAES